MRPRISVRGSVRPLVYPSVSRSVGNASFLNSEKRTKRRIHLLPKLVHAYFIVFSLARVFRKTSIVKTLDNPCNLKVKLRCEYKGLSTVVCVQWFKYSGLSTEVRVNGLSTAV